MYRFAVLFVMMALLGCLPYPTGPAPYVQKGSSSYEFGMLFGYSDEKLAEGVYFVRFEGNHFNTMPEVVGYVKQRAAELCGSTDFEAEIRRFNRLRTEASPNWARSPAGYLHPAAPTVEARVKCKARQ